MCTVMTTDRPFDQINQVLMECAVNFTAVKQISHREYRGNTFRTAFRRRAIKRGLDYDLNAASRHDGIIRVHVFHTVDDQAVQHGPAVSRLLAHLLSVDN